MKTANATTLSQWVMLRSERTCTSSAITSGAEDSTTEQEQTRQ